MITLLTYLLLDGNCAAAMRFYHECLGGTLAMTTVGDSPMRAMFPESMHGRVINARLSGGAADISASDWMRPDEARVAGNAVCLYLSGGTPEETRSLFAKLSRGANVTDPLAEQPFGLYGALNDAFGVRWMFHANRAART